MSKADDHEFESPSRRGAPRGRSSRTSGSLSTILSDAALPLSPRDDDVASGAKSVGLDSLVAAYISVSVPSFASVLDEKGKQLYVVFCVEVFVNGADGSSWLVYRRYSDFLRLRKVLVSKAKKTRQQRRKTMDAATIFEETPGEYGRHRRSHSASASSLAASGFLDGISSPAHKPTTTPHVPTLPSKHSFSARFSRRRSSLQFLRCRAAGLESWLSAVLEIPLSLESAAVHQFLTRDAGKPPKGLSHKVELVASSPSISGGRSASPGMPISPEVNSPVWSSSVLQSRMIWDDYEKLRGSQMAGELASVKVFLTKETRFKMEQAGVLHEGGLLNPTRAAGFIRMLANAPRPHAREIPRNLTRLSVGAGLRAAVWSALLNLSDVGDEKSNKRKGRGPINESSRDLIDMDTKRSCMGVEGKEAGREKLKQILIAWEKLNPENEYKQGLDSVAIALLSVFQGNSEASLRGLVAVIGRFMPGLLRRQIPGGCNISEISLNAMMRKMSCVTVFHDPPLSNHLFKSGVVPSLYAVSSFFCAYRASTFFDFLFTAVTLASHSFQPRPSSRKGAIFMGRHVSF